MKDAQREFADIKKRQSRSLSEAVKEYRRRYGMPPPPHFDKWYEFAVSNKVQLVDEFDTVHDMMTPYWGLQPQTLRARVAEALGYDNGLLGVAIRDHEIMHMEYGFEWQRNATKGMMDKFLQYLPDMDLAFNIHDEPRVVVPHDDLSRLVRKAKDVNMAALSGKTKLVNGFSARPSDVNDGKTFKETKLTRFSTIRYQSTWADSRMSCPPDSQARILEDEERADDLSRYGVSDLAFVYNTTAMSDICLTPSLSSTYGFFDRPNVFKVTHDLLPIFSQSKISSYGDIVYPSPWYWYKKVAYNESNDMPWDDKESKLYWRGSTTGGYSRNGGWRRHHRQRFVQKINSKEQAKIMAKSGGITNAPESPSKWEPKEVPRGDYQKLIDVHFSHVGQCDPGDCEAQREFFDVVDLVDQQDAWGYKYLVDMDGNAFSGRFYAFLQSRSLTFKLALFREWHSERLRPWVHYVPLSLQGDDWLEAVRFIDQDGEGSAEGRRIAEESREWANQAVRKVDMEVWFFRLLLEYARVIDDNRENLGFEI
ncbi:glycosyltransferase family 90 protein [Trichoderma citrinoviride]|uniref:Glycosyltransferase family 90 protein n=1 Tax=Trichoderma citrinoviride TaxID=58853 RepID=A0A2T4BD88_9HYPO|nr:glycosyltransferase family 90 protein [Trichoderma citrinoviride]PTB67302.1 glycosyltransferase family 90 protein [Trichoderma citrinoviride]